MAPLSPAQSDLAKQLLALDIGYSPAQARAAARRSNQLNTICTLPYTLPSSARCHLAAAWLEAHAHEASSPGGLTWEGAIETDGAAGSSMPEFCQKVVLAMETEAEAPVPQTMPAALRHWPVRAFYLDGDRKNHLFEDFPMCYPPPPPGSAEAAPKLFYLLKPGHYDMLYARPTYGGDAMGSGGGSMGPRPVLPMGPEEGSACETFGFPQGERADGVRAGSVVATLNAGVERAKAAIERGGGGGGNAADDGVFRLLGPHCIAPTRLLPDERNFSRVELDECDDFAAREHRWHTPTLMRNCSPEAASAAGIRRRKSPVACSI